MAFGIDIEQFLSEISTVENQPEGKESKQGKVFQNVAKKIGTNVVIPALLGMAEEIPVIGHISKLLSMCGSALQELNNQDPLVQNLRIGISKVTEALQAYEKVFQFNDEDELMRTLPLSELEGSLEKALMEMIAWS
jgi:hypothetical protein